MKEAKIIFADGEELKVEENGNCYITDKPFKKTPEELASVEIKHESETEILEKPQIKECASTDKRFWFYFYTPSKEEIEKQEIKEIIAVQAANIDYLAMMSNVDL